MIQRFISDASCEWKCNLRCLLPQVIFRIYFSVSSAYATLKLRRILLRLSQQVISAVLILVHSAWSACCFKMSFARQNISCESLAMIPKRFVASDDLPNLFSSLPAYATLKYRHNLKRLLLQVIWWIYFLFCCIYATLKNYPEIHLGRNFTDQRILPRLSWQNVLSPRIFIPEDRNPLRILLRECAARYPAVLILCSFSLRHLLPQDIFCTAEIVRIYFSIFRKKWSGTCSAVHL